MIGDSQDILGRLLSNLPVRWFPQTSLSSPANQTVPILSGLLSGLSSAYASIYSLLQYVYAQGRLQTASGFNLDIFALDYFGENLSRRPGESDFAFSTRIQANLLIPRGTRQSISNAIKLLTGNAPKIFEPGNTNDAGGYASILHPHRYYGAAYSFAGGYGSLKYPAQLFITATGPSQFVNPASDINGYAGYLSGYGNGTTQSYSAGAYSEYLSGSLNTGSVTDSDIYNAVAINLPAGVIGWVAISS